MRIKTLRIVLALLVMTITVSGCKVADVSKPASGGKKLTIVTSFYPMYVHTINITKGIPGVNVVNMTEPQKGCLHDYALSTDNMKTLSDAQVFIINGAGMESFMDKVISQLPDLNIIEASRGIELIKEEYGQSPDGKENDDAGGGNGQEGNPHVWVSITNAIQQVKNIGRKLGEINPDNASLYKTNTEAYVRKLQEEKDKMHRTLDALKKKDIVTFHEAFPYFAKEFSLNIAAVIEREPGSEPGARELKETIEKIKKQNIKALFTEPQYSPKAAETIARETGAKIYSLDPGVTGEANGDTDAYIKMMDKNMTVLREALK